MKSGKIRCLAVSTRKRSPVVPELPTLEEEGIKGYEHSLWSGIFVPMETPPAIVNEISAGFSGAVKSPDVVKRLAELGFEPVGSSPEEFKRFFGSEVAKWATVIKKTGIHAD